MDTRKTRMNAVPVLKNRLRNSSGNTIKNAVKLTKRKSTQSSRTAFGDLTNKGNTASNSKTLKLKTLLKSTSSKLVKKPCQEKCTKMALIKEDIPEATPMFVDMDAKDAGDPLNGGPYCYRIFEYLKSREPKFVIRDYLQWQTELIPNMRAVLIDWMVEVQENFELNHETLYMAVKLVDLYLNYSTKTQRTSLQLIGATSLFLSAKYDERSPPALDDFLYICDDAYTRNELLQMEVDILNTLQFDIGMPLSYRFLRRYSKCGGYELVCLTLARFILESSLLDYQFISESDSKMAAACILLSTRMLKCDDWNPTMIHYTGRTEQELETLVRRLNYINVHPTHTSLTTILQKYRHKVFMSVANVPALPIEPTRPL